jgi:hypothetical protein
MVTREHVEVDILVTKPIKEPCAPGVPNLKIDELAPVDHVTQVDDCGNIVFFYVREENVLKESVKIFVDMWIFTTGTKVCVVD